MTIPSSDTIHFAIDEIFGAESERSVDTFSSGAVSITIHDAGRVAVIDGTSGGEWGVSVDPDDATAMSGHDSVVESFFKALETASNKLRGH